MLLTASRLERQTLCGKFIIWTKKKNPQIAHSQAATDEVKQYVCGKIALKSAMNYGDFLQSRVKGKTQTIETSKQVFESPNENLNDYTLDENGVAKKR